MKILAYTSPARGHLFPLVPILDELARRGHTIAVRTLASEVELMRARGFEASPIAGAISAIEHDDFEAKSPPAKIKRALGVLGRRAVHEVDDLRAAITETAPDALLVDCNAYGATAAAQAWGGPWAQWFPYPMPLPGAGVPPFGPGFKPARNVLARTRDTVLSPVFARMFAGALLPAFNAARPAAGVPPITGPEELFSLPPLVLYMTAESFDYPREWPPNVRLVGPCAWDPPAEAPGWLDEIDRPLVVVNTSSEFQDDGRLVRTALDALADEEVFVVATMPSADLAGPVPANARVERFVPHGPLLARAACAVTHGGMGATQKALANGVPVCVVPFGRDQLEVARRVEVAGAGTRLPSPKLRPDRLRAKVREAMGLRAGAERVAAGYRATGGAAAAADAFEALAPVPLPG
jgi:MGT family glycosyltransferase